MKKTLIALAVIAAGALAANSAEVPVGTKFEAEDGVADALIADGKAKLAETSPAKPEKVTKVRLLIDSHLGKANDVVELDSAGLKDAENGGLADSTKAAVAYASSLPQNQT